ncbi:MAG TPA: hypothetical protein VII40_03065, partial [Xanthobacteraceae bacterium]
GRKRGATDIAIPPGRQNPDGALCILPDAPGRTTSSVCSRQYARRAIIDADFGFLDYQEKAELAISEAATSIDNINKLIEEIDQETNRMIERTEVISAPGIPAIEKKRVINSFAEFLKNKANKLKEEAKIGAGRFATFSEMIIFLLPIEQQMLDKDKYKEDIDAFLRMAEGLLQVIPKNRESVAAFKRTIENIPRITAEFNKAKKLLVEALDDCVMIFDQAERSIFEITAKT